MAIIRQMAAMLVLIAVLAGCGGSKPAAGPGALFDPAQVKAVVVAWDPDLKGAPPPRRTEERNRFAPLLAVLAKVDQKVEPYDLLGPPTHISLEVKGGTVRKFELWPPYLADVDNKVTYFLDDKAFQALQKALELLSPPPIGAPPRLSGTITVPQLVEALKAHGLEDARQTGERIGSLLFGARAGEVVELLGQTVQVYELASPEEARKAAAVDPHDMPIEWVAPPTFVAVGNLVVTVVVPDKAYAEKIVAYLRMVGE